MANTAGFFHYPRTFAEVQQLARCSVSDYRRSTALATPEFAENLKRKMT